jgi:hypothetical protein
MWIAGFSIVLSLVVAPSPADAWPCGPDDLSPRAPLYYLNHCERPFADILAEFSRDTGYPITGRMPSGTVTLDCGREVMPFDLALTRLNVVLLSADGSPYLRRNTLNSSLEIRRMVEQCSMSIDFDWIFTSVDKFVQSNAQRSQLVILLYRSRAGQYPTIAPQLELLPSTCVAGPCRAIPIKKHLGLMGAAVDIRHYVPLVQMLDETCAHKNQKVSEFQLRFAEPAAVADCIRQAHPRRSGFVHLASSASRTFNAATQCCVSGATGRTDDWCLPVQRIPLSMPARLPWPSITRRIAPPMQSALDGRST